MQARLKVVQDNANLKQVKLLPITVIGRGADCHLKIASTQVSRKHCRLTVTETEVLIEDLTSSNGTFVDQKKIAPGKPIVIAPGSKLQIGPATFIVDYTPPVNLENAPTTVIKSSEMPALSEAATPKGGSEASIPTVDPFAAAVADGSHSPGAMTPIPPLMLPPAENCEFPVSGATTSKPSGAVSESEMTIMETLPITGPQVAAPLIMEANTQEAVAPASTASPPPTAVPAPQPGTTTGIGSAGAFDFLGGAATAAVEPSAFEAFQFGVAAPAASQETTSSSGAKPIATKKPLLGLFGRKGKAGAQPSDSAAAPTAAATPSASGETDPTQFGPPSTVPAETPMTQPVPADPAPPAGDDPFAFLR